MGGGDLPSSENTRERIAELVTWPVVRSESPESVARRLSDVPVDALVDVVVDAGEPGWRRRACAQALLGRVTVDRAMGLVDRVQGSDLGGDLRAALLDILSVSGRPGSDEVFRWLREQEASLRERWPYGFADKVLAERARLGDISAARPLAVLAAEPWRHRRVAGEESIDALVEAHGLPAVLAEYGADSPETLATRGSSVAERLLGLRLLWRRGGDITASLADDSVLVARAAYELMAGTSGDDDALLAMVEERRPGHLWALAVLHRRGHDIRAAWEALGPPRVELPGVPSDVRKAILREYTPGQRGTDPRWLLEAACLEPEGADEDVLRRAVDELDAAGLRPEKPRPAAEHQGVGSGTYHVIATTAGKVRVSTLGPFFSLIGEHEDARVITAMRAAGLRHIDGDLAATRFTGLHVYYFGAREPLDVGTLLFYWQD
ncbi:hypothetical protein [Actinomadura miaoliensis]|uniref:HEAT repeat domain-containing protein n=1 Tax=Actinomadura miaoliensis TaxID=430685 RepID=A0ABP7WLY6_9ACTN